MQIKIQEHNQAPALLWGSPGAAYDEISRGISTAIEHAVERLAPKPGERILDVATGTGWAARRIAERGANVTGMDFAAEVVEAARDIAARRNYDIAFDVGDAEALHYEDGTFDAVISTFGVMFASNPERATRELTRVCRPGGRLVLATWTPDGNVFNMFKVMKAYMEPPKGTPAPSPFETWGEPERVIELLGETFDLTFEKGTTFYREPNAAQAWETFVSGYGPTRTLHNKLDEEGKGSLERAFIAFHEAFKSELGICVPRDYWVIAGTRR